MCNSLLNHFIGLNTFVNNIFRAVLLTLFSAFTGEGFVVSSAERIGESLYPSGKARVLPTQK
jgi:hypothetical protein